MLKRLNDMNQREALGNLCLGAAGLDEGTNAATIKTVNAIDYAIDGILYSKAATDNIAMNALAAQADLTDCMYLVTIDASGTVVLVKGNAVAAGGDCELPDLPDGYCAIGAIKIALSGGTFTSGTTDLSGTGVTATYYDFMICPAATF
jgi:hypothetical protein